MRRSVKVVAVAVIVIVLISFLQLQYSVFYQQRSQPPDSFSYVVQNGDTLYKIGMTFGVPWQSIA